MKPNLKTTQIEICNNIIADLKKLKLLAFLRITSCNEAVVIVDTKYIRYCIHVFPITKEIKIFHPFPSLTKPHEMTKIHWLNVIQFFQPITN